MISDWRDTLLCSPSPTPPTELQRCWAQLSLVFICHGFPFLWNSHLHLSVKYTDSKWTRNAIISHPVGPELLNSWRSAEAESEDWCVGKQFKFFTGNYSQCHYLLFIRMKISPLCLFKKVVRTIALNLFLRFVRIMWQRGKVSFALFPFPSLFFFFPKQAKISPINVPISEGKELLMHTLILVVRPIRKSWNDWYLKCYHLRQILPSSTDLQQLRFSFFLSLFFLFFLHTKTTCKPRRILLATFFFFFWSIQCLPLHLPTSPHYAAPICTHTPFSPTHPHL